MTGKFTITKSGILKKYEGNDTEVIIPEGVKKIGWEAFSDCYSLTSVTIPDSVTEIGWEAFSGCKSLASITIPEGVTKIGEYAFRYCTSLTSVTIPDGVKKIGGRAFYGCESLTSVTIPESVTEIGDCAFSGYKSLTSVNADEKNRAFSSIDGVLFNKKKTMLKLYPRGKSGKKYTIPDGVTKIGDWAFCGCENLYDAPIRVFDQYDKVKNCFRYLEDMDSLSENNRKSYDKYINSQKKRLFPKIIKNGSAEVLTNFLKLGFISAKNFDEYFDIVNKSGKTELIAIMLEFKSKNISDEALEKEEEKRINRELNANPLSLEEMKKIWGFAKREDGTYRIIKYKGTDTDVEIPPVIGTKNIPVTEIGKYAFWGRKSLTSITIPDGVTEIGFSAFSGCTNLTSITIPDGVKKIGRRAFDGCDKLVVHCHKGSYAEKTCKSRKIKIQIIED